MNNEFRTDYPHGSRRTPNEWPSFTIGPAPATDNWRPCRPRRGAGRGQGRQPASCSPRASSTGPTRTFPRGTYVELYKVTGAAEVSRGEFAISGKVTRLALSGQNLDTQFFGFVRETSVYRAVRGARRSRRIPVVDRVVNGDQLPLAIAADGLLAGRRVIVHGDARRRQRARGARGHAGQRRTPIRSGAVLTIAPPLPVALKRETVVVHANVALATHGETVAQILGAGDASASFQRFELKRTAAHLPQRDQRDRRRQRADGAHRRRRMDRAIHAVRRSARPNASTR